jgi:3-oxoadipate enol-lactonase
MPFAVTDDLHIYYELSAPDDENAPRLLFIGGTGGDLRVKPSVMHGPLAKAFHLLAYDQRGLGQTFGHQGPFTMEQYADDAAAVMNHAGWDKAHVYGISFGGMVAQNFVIKHPGLVDKLALACTSAGGASASFPLHTIHGLDGRERFEFMLGISDTRNNAAWQRENPDQVTQMWEAAQAQRKDIPVSEASIHGAREQIEARQHHDTRAGLKNIEAQTFICGGKFDAMAPPSNLEFLHENIPNSVLTFYEGGHLFMIQDPKAIEDLMSFMLAGN